MKTKKVLLWVWELIGYDGWEVIGYSEFDCFGKPKFVELQK